MSSPSFCSQFPFNSDLFCSSLSSAFSTGTDRPRSDSSKQHVIRRDSIFHCTQHLSTITDGHGTCSWLLSLRHALRDAQTPAILSFYAACFSILIPSWLLSRIHSWGFCGKTFILAAPVNRILTAFCCGTHSSRVTDSRHTLGISCEVTFFFPLCQT